MIETLFYWTGAILIFSIMAFAICFCWVYMLNRLWVTHSNYLVLRKFALKEKPTEFREYIRRIDKERKEKKKK